MNWIGILPEIQQCDLLLFALLTVLIEVPIFWLCKYRTLKAVSVYTLVNIVSNLLLNEFLIFQDFYGYSVIFLGEITVVFLEYCLCRCLLKITEPLKLFFVVLLTNVVSFTTGVLIFWE